METLIKPNWDNFKAKFSENPQDNFEWFCYLLFSKEYNQPYGTHRYKNQSGIETDPIEVGDEVIGWQSKFYETKLSDHKRDLISMLETSKRDYPNITKIIFYTNVEWSKYHETKTTKAEKTSVQKSVEEKAQELDINLIWMLKGNFEIYCQEKRNLEISRYFFELDTKWELTNNGFKDTLRYCYLKNFKTISLLDEKKKRISDIFVNIAIIKDKIEEENKDKLINREAYLNSYEEIHKPKEPIKIKELINTSKKSLIYGKAGVGKTTLCKYIAYNWAKGKLYKDEFEYVVYIPLRKWDSTQLKEVIRSYYYSQYNKEINIDIKANSNKILFLFDGYDELKTDKRDGLEKAIRDNNLTHYIITSRPYGYQRNDFRVDEHFETIGFTDEDLEEYIENFFDKVEKQQALKEFLKSNIGIKHIAYIPLMLEMICSLWVEESFSDSLTMTELYSQVVENILNRYSAFKDDDRVYKRKNRKKIKEYLGKIAFEGLTKQSIFFDGDLIEEAIQDIDFFEENVIYSGFLKSDRQEKDLLDNNFEFPHLTFQEYFSALYVASLSKEEQSEIIRDWKFYPHMQMFFAFLGGLIKDKEFLLREIDHNPRDLTGYYELCLILSFLNEIEINEHLESRIKKLFYFLKKRYGIDSKEFNLFLNKIKTTKYKDAEISFNIERKKSIDGVLKFASHYNKEEIKKNIDIEAYLKNMDSNESLRAELLKNLQNVSNNNDDRIVKKLEEYISSNIELGLSLQVLKLINRTDDNFIKILISVIENYKITYTDKLSIIRKFIILNSFSDFYIQNLIRLIKNNTIYLDFNLFIESQLRNLITFNIFSEIYSTMPKELHTFMKGLKIEILFKAFDEKVENIEDIFLSNLIYSKKPFYIKNRKLHTIENGKEISTEREVDKKTLTEIQTLISPTRTHP